MEKENNYLEIQPSKELEDFVHSFWTHKNNLDKPELITIFPDSFFKIIFIEVNGQIINYFMTGLWTEQKDFTVPSNATIYGCRLKILAPEFLLCEEVASIINDVRKLDLHFLNITSFDLSEFNITVQQWELELKKIQAFKIIQENKLRLSTLLYSENVGISATEVANQIFWTNRQINRYLNKYLGVSLKKYLNIQKCSTAYIQIREGTLFPEKNYFDQAHFIREVKKHTGETPRTLYKKQNDRFIQLRNIKKN